MNIFGSLRIFLSIIVLTVFLKCGSFYQEKLIIEFIVPDLSELSIKQIEEIVAYEFVTCDNANPIKPELSIVSYNSDRSPYNERISHKEIEEFAEIFKTDVEDPYLMQQNLDALLSYDHIYSINSTKLSEKLNVEMSHFTTTDQVVQSIMTDFCSTKTIGKYVVTLNFDETDISQNVDVENAIPEFSEEALYNMAFETFWKFTEAQNLLANNDNKNFAEEIIENTLRLFNSPESIVQIQNTSSDKPLSIDVKNYLKRLYTLNRYDEVSIEWNGDLKVIQPWRERESEIPESSFTMIGRQQFKGFHKNMILYSDSIDKSIELHAKIVESVDITGQLILEWQIFIGNILVIDSPRSLTT